MLTSKETFGMSKEEFLSARESGRKRLKDEQLFLKSPKRQNSNLEMPMKLLRKQKIFMIRSRMEIQKT